MSQHEKFAWGSLFATLLNARADRESGKDECDLGTLPVLFYALLTVLFLGHTTSQAVTIWLYRA